MALRISLGCEGLGKYLVKFYIAYCFEQVSGDVDENTIEAMIIKKIGYDYDIDIV
jgi:hypothetical protein